jgi:hypothetical protein
MNPWQAISRETGEVIAEDVKMSVCSDKAFAVMPWSGFFAPYYITRGK